MSVKIGFSKPGKVLGRSDNKCGPQPAKEFTSVCHGLPGIGGNRTGTQNGAGCLEREVNDRREIGIKSQGAATLADEPAVFAKEPSQARRKNIGSSGSASRNIAETINPAAFHINASQEGGGDAAAAIFQESVGLLPGGDVASKQDYTGRLHQAQQGTQRRRNLGTVESNDEKLADLLA
jgi:hypothetical protein